MPSHQQDPAAVRVNATAGREFADSGFPSQPQFADAPTGTAAKISVAYTSHGRNATLFHYLSLAPVRFRTVNQAFFDRMTSCRWLARHHVRRWKRGAMCLPEHVCKGATALPASAAHCGDELEMPTKV
jgi:hypothetical protein